MSSLTIYLFILIFLDSLFISDEDEEFIFTHHLQFMSLSFLTTGTTPTPVSPKTPLFPTSTQNVKFLPPTPISNTTTTPNTSLSRRRRRWRRAGCGGGFHCDGVQSGRAGCGGVNAGVVVNGG
ncbi:hypothetical protein HanRHA438_Chr15g0688731 [Helianthus annuus]|nr:hypothetical protein HanRHA438_Chr15g0688731 [Helianthus annuus]